MGLVKRRLIQLSIFSSIGIAFAIYTVSSYYGIEAGDVPVATSKEIAAHVFSVVYGRDLDFARQTANKYYIGVPVSPSTDPKQSWAKLASTSGDLQIKGGNGLTLLQKDIPFVFDTPDSEELKKLREQYRLKDLVSPEANEFAQMLRLLAWIGSRWDHGEDRVPSPKPCSIIAAGERGARFRCDIAARVTVQAATALGWPSRLITASSDGYHWRHGLAELWSNRFNKWILVDPDYNIFYESGGIPLSAFELCHNGCELSRIGKLHVVRFAPLKPGLKEVDLLPLFRYVHVDLRNDWLSRRLSPGSPAGGDLATWWTARPDLQNLLTAKIRVDRQERFDWKVNAVEIYALQLKKNTSNEYELAVGLRGYSPYFDSFLARMDDGPWQRTRVGKWTYVVEKGRHVIRARISNTNGEAGPIYQVCFNIK